MRPSIYIFYKLFFPSTIIGWNKVDFNNQNFQTLSVFVKKPFELCMIFRKSPFNCYSAKGVRYNKRFRLRPSHFCEHKFNHSFQDTLILLYDYGSALQTTIHYLELVVTPLP